MGKLLSSSTLYRGADESVTLAKQQLARAGEDDIDVLAGGDVKPFDHNGPVELGRIGRSANNDTSDVRVS